MITESRDYKSGITRHDMDTTNPEKCRECLEATGLVTNKWQGNRLTRYLIEFNGKQIEARVSPARVVFFSTDRYALKGFEEIIHMEEWEYDNSTRNDYMAKR